MLNTTISNKYLNRNKSRHTEIELNYKAINLRFYRYFCLYLFIKGLFLLPKQLWAQQNN